MAHGEGTARKRTANALLGRLEQFIPTTQDAPPEEPSALEQLSQRCLQQSDLIQAHQPEPMRLVHHFACTGGTLISRALAAQPNSLMLSELDPLSLISTKGRFAPSDVLQMASLNREQLSPETKVAVFCAGLKALYKDAVAEGRHVIVRDHTHSHFCAAPAPETRPLITDMLRPLFNLRNIITVRHPLDSYAALLVNNWAGPAVKTLGTYADRYIKFLDSYPDIPLFYYEDFVSDPDKICQQMTQALELAFNPHWQDILPATSLSGDSGRRSNEIALRPRRTIRPSLQKEIEKGAPEYERLCQRLGYDPDPAGSSCPTRTGASSG